MDILLDTCAFLWIISGDGRLSDKAARTFRDAGNRIFLSAVSAWEISIKHSLARLPLPGPPSRFVPEQRERHGIASLPLSEDAALQLEKIPALHRDPFDRMLVAQAISAGLIILTPDERIQRYPVRTIW